MSLEKRDNLLGAWAIHCDTQDCHIEVLSISEKDVETLATSEGWTLQGTTHICGDCASGTSPLDVIKGDSPQATAQAPTLAAKLKDEDKDAPSFDERSGATIPDVMAKAEDLETPEEQEQRKRREKRRRERQALTQKESNAKTLAAMGGVNDLLDDFDGMFGNSKTTWDD